MTPLEIAHLPGAAENLILPGAWHLPRRDPKQQWYGDPQIVDSWEGYLMPSSVPAEGAGQARDK